MILRRRASPLGYGEKALEAANREASMLTTLLLVAATFALTGCASYHRFRPTPVEYSGVSREGKDLGDMTDAAVVSYADRVQDTLRKRFHISRVAREASSTMQVLLAGAAGISAAFTAGATAVAGMAFGSAVMPQLGGIFDTGARAIAYQQAVAKISVAENAYFRIRAGRSPVVPSNVLTVEGALLYEAVNGATDAVELFQAGMLPTLDQLQRAEALELRRRAAIRTGESKRSTGPIEDGGRGRESDIGNPKPGPAPQKNAKAGSESESLKMRREKLVPQVGKLPGGAAAIIIQQPTMEDANARGYLQGLIEHANDPLLKRLEQKVQEQMTESATILPDQRSDATLASRREKLAQEIDQLPAGAAARILQPAGTPPFDDETARIRLGEMAKDAEDPLLADLERKVHGQASQR
jgi:hypothetical protein